ncbi:MAG: hypothetical protein JO129_03930 [Candidatus Dependentiae bacterium]|nr:hypothetical protein [Candidatus Dependentiae bacterium]
MKKLYLVSMLFIASNQIILAASWLKKAENYTGQEINKISANVSNQSKNAFKSVDNNFQQAAQSFQADIEKAMASNCPATNFPAAPAIQIIPSITITPAVTITNNSISIANLPVYLASITTITPAVLANLQTNITTLKNARLSMQAQIVNLNNNNESMIKSNGSIGGVLGAAAGLGFAAGTLGSTPPCADVAAGAAIGAVIGVEAVDGAKLSCNNNQIAALKAQILIIETAEAYINALLISKLTIAQLQALTQTQIQAMPDSTVTAMIPYMTPMQLASLPSRYFTYASNATLQLLNQAQVQALPPSTIAALTPDMTALQKSEIAGQVAALKAAAAKVSKISNPTNNLAAVQAIIKPITSVLLSIGTYFAQNIGGSQIAAFTPQQFSYMTKNQILAISPVQLQIITGAQFAAIQPTIIPFMTDAQIAFTTPLQWIAITPAQQAQLTADQITSLAFLQLAEQVVGFILTPACFGGPGLVA